MSALLLGQVFAFQFRPAEQLVMLCLADHAHDDGAHCYPSVPRVAWKTGYSVRQVQRIMAKLRRDGVLEVTGHPYGGRGSVEYRIHLNKALPKPPYQEPPNPEQPAISAPGRQPAAYDAPAPAAPIVTVPRRRDVNGDPLDPPPAPVAREDDDQRIAREDDAECDQLRIVADQKRAWYAHLCQLQGSPPIGDRNWDRTIDDLIAQRVTPQEFTECWALIAKKWKDGVVHVLSVYNHLGEFLPLVRKAAIGRLRSAKANAAIPPPPPVTDDDRRRAKAQREQLREEARIEEQMHAIGVHTRGHIANCLCKKCLDSKRDWLKRQREEGNRP